MANDTERIERFKRVPFYDGPTEFLVKAAAEQVASVKQFTLIFGDYIDAYKRMDYPLRSLPALRIFNEAWTKESESGFITGDVLAHVIFPASLRREEQQQLQDTISAALCQIFRSPEFFAAVREKVPGLNQLGRVFSVDKSLGFEWADGIVPLTQITINFRLDLRIWDDYLEATCRTKDSPFEQVLGNLDKIVAQIEAMKNDFYETPDVTVGIETDQKS